MSIAEILNDLLIAIAVSGVTALLARASLRVSGFLIGSDSPSVTSNTILTPGSHSEERQQRIHQTIGPFHWSLSLTAALLIAWAVIVLMAMLLNSCGMLHPVALHMAIATASIALGWLYRDHHPSVFKAAHVDQILLFAVSLVTTQVIMFGLVTLPTDWDTLAYHLPLIDHWVRSGNLSDTDTAFWYVPGNFELLGYFFSGAFSGDFWAPLSNTPVIALLAVATIALCRELGLHRSTASWVCFGAVTNPIVLRQAWTLENDVAVAALFIAATLFGVRAIKTGKFASLILCGIAIGLLAGVKYYAIAYVAVVSVTVTLLMMAAYGLRCGCRALIAFGLGIAVFAGFWYARNFIISGTPLFPKGVALLGLEGPWDEQRPDFVKTCLILGFQRADLPRLLVAWGLYGGTLLTVSLLMSPFVILLRTIFLLASLARSKTTHSRQSSCLGTNRGVLADREFQPNPEGADVWAQIAVLTCAMGSIAVYLVTPNVLETYPGSRNMLRLQYHPVRFGFSAAILGLIALTNTICQLYRSFSRSEQTQAEATGKPVEVVHGNHSSSVRTFVYRQLTLSRPWALPLLALSSAAIALLPQYGWRREFLEHGLRVWRPSGLDYPVFVWFVATIDVGVLWLALFQLFSSRSKKRTVAAFWLIGSTIAIATFLLTHHWHGSYDDHFESVGPISLAAPFGETIAGRRTVVCEYRYYATLGSRRQNDVSRPLFASNSAMFQRYLESRKAEVVVALRRDVQWSQSYAICYWFLNSPESGFILSESTDQYGIFTRRRNNDSKPAIPDSQ